MSSVEEVIAVAEPTPHFAHPEAAFDAAWLALEDALAGAFQSLQQPECTRLLGPLVPGATMAFGARVPGTSYQLDPVQAAFSLGTMLGWHDAGDPAFVVGGSHVADTLGAVLAVGDYRARKLIAEGLAPPTVRDLLQALLHAHDCAANELSRAGASPHRAQRCDAIRVASACAAATLLGQSPARVHAAAALARAEATSHGTMHERWRLGDATSRGVRLALIAAAGPVEPEPVASLGDRGFATGPLVAVDWSAITADAGRRDRVRERFNACVTSHFPAAQAGRIAALFEHRATCERLPLNELVSMTVRN